MTRTSVCPPLFLCAILTALVSITACARADTTVIALRADMPAVDLAKDKRAVPMLHEPLPDANLLRTGMRIAPSQAYRWVFEPEDDDDTRRVDVTIAAIDASEADEVVMTVWDWRNRPIATRAWAVPFEHRVRFEVKGRGTWLVTIDGLRQGKARFRMSRSFSVSPENKPGVWTSYEPSSDNARDRFFIGMCAFPGRMHWTRDGQTVHPPDMAESDARNIDAELVARLGVQVARLDVSMNMTSTKPSLFNRDGFKFDFARMDDAVSAFTTRGLQLDLQLMNPPDWAIADKYATVESNKWRYPHRDDAYRAYVQALVKRYGKHAEFVQVFNEPDQPLFWAGEPDEFVDMFRQATKAIRSERRGRDLPITNGGYAFIDVDRTKHYVAQLKGKLDLISYHSHGDLRELKHDMQLARQLHKDAGYASPRIINTETGFAVWRLDQERAQAITTLHKLLYAWSHGDEGMLLFCSRMTSGPARADRDFGFVDYYFCPRFAYGATAAFIDLFADARFERVSREEAGVHVYAFKTPKGRIVATFAESTATSKGDGAAALRDVTIVSDARSATIVDVMGNRARAPKAARVTVRPDVYATYIVLEGASTVDVE